MTDDGYVQIDEHFLCQCSWGGHTVRLGLSRWRHGEAPDLEAEVYLYQYAGFLQRLWLAFKYIFKIRSCSSHFDSWMFRPSDVQRLEQLLAKYKELLSSQTVLSDQNEIPR